MVSATCYRRELNLMNMQLTSARRHITTGKLRIALILEVITNFVFKVSNLSPIAWYFQPDAMIVSPGIEPGTGF